MQEAEHFTNDLYGFKNCNAGRAEGSNDRVGRSWVLAGNPISAELTFEESAKGIHYVDYDW